MSGLRPQYKPPTLERSSEGEDIEEPRKPKKVVSNKGKNQASWFPNTSKWKDVPSYEAFNMEWKDLSMSGILFNGLRFEVSGLVWQERGLTISHALTLPASDEDPGAYTFSANGTVPILGQELSIQGRLDNGTFASARVGTKLGPFVAKLTSQASPQGSASSTELVWASNRLMNATLRYAPGMLHGTAAFAVYSGTSLGVEAMYQSQGQESGIMSTAGLRHVTDNTITTVSAPIQWPPRVAASHTRHLTDMLTVGAESTWTYNGTSASTPVFDVDALVGAQLSMRASKIRTTLDSNFVVSAMLDEMISPASQMQFAVTLDHAKQKYQFGLGINVNF